MNKIKEVIDSYKKDNENYYSANTLDNYVRSIDKFFALENEPIHEISPNVVKQYFRKIKRSSSSTKNVIRCALNSFFNYCIEEGILTNNPAQHIKVSTIINNTPPPMSEIEIFKLREVTRPHKRDHAMIELLLCSGVRVTELSNILISEINWKRESININNAKGNNARIVFFSYQCKTILCEYLDTRNDDIPQLFITRRGRPFTRQGISKLLKGYIDKAGLRPEISVHTCRHTFGTDCIKRGFSIKETSKLLGHKTIQSSNRYCHLPNELVRNEYDKHR